MEQAREHNEPRASAEVVFRRMIPTEHLLSVVREQDGLYRGVVHVENEPTHVTIERAEDGQRTTFKVIARAQARGVERTGCAESPYVEFAAREAFTELLRHTVNSAAKSPCARAA